MINVSNFFKLYIQTVGVTKSCRQVLESLSVANNSTT